MPNYQDLLSNLLAVIHADGGHYESEHGTEKAVTDAIEKVVEMKAYLTPLVLDDATGCPNCLYSSGEGHAEYCEFAEPHRR